MINFLKKYWKQILVIAVFIMIPILVGHFMDHGFYASYGGASDDGWLGFWGGYLGSAASILFAYINTKMQIKINKENETKIRNMKRINNLLSNSMRTISKIYPVSQEIHENLQIKNGKFLKFKKINELQNIVHDFMTEWNSVAVTLQLDDITELNEKMDGVRISFNVFEVFCASSMNILVAKDKLDQMDYKKLKDIEDGVQNFIEKFSELINTLTHLYDIESRK